MSGATDSAMRSDMTGAAKVPNAVLEVELRVPLAHFALECNFQAEREVVVLFGPSGAGKTSVLDCVAGFRQPQEGRIALGGRTLFCSRSGVNLSAQQRRIGYLSQQPALFPHLTVRQNVGYGLHDLPREQREPRVDAILERFHVAHLAASRPAAISGGEQQRVALARTLVCEPELLLLDEPLSALDLRLKTLLLDALFDWQRERGVPMLYVTHDRSEAFTLARRVLVIEHGRVVADGPPHAVFDAPVSREQAALSGYENIFAAVVEEAHPALGTMTCRIADSSLLLEAPLARRSEGEGACLALRAGDILVATSRPSGISARNVLAGRIRLIEDRDGMAELRVLCGEEGREVDFCVHVTRGALRDLELQAGQSVWLIVKTHSIQFLREQP
jgi:molybdate transport system ATP-binding protein